MHRLFAPPLLAIAAIAAWPPGCGAADRISEFEASAAYDSNLNNGHFRSDIHGDFTSGAATSQGLLFPLGEYGGATLTGDLRLQTFGRFAGMDNLALGPSLGYRTKFGLGPTAPWLAAAVSASRLDYQNSIRNGWQSVATLRAGRRIDAHWDLSAELRIDQRTADQAHPLAPGFSGDVFRVKGRSGALSAGYGPNEKTLFSLSYGLRSGDVVSTTQRNAGIFRVSAAVAEDPVFGDEQYAYRLHAITQLAALRASQALTGNSSLTVGFQRQVSRGDGGNNYAKNLVDLVYLYSF